MSRKMVTNIKIISMDPSTMVPEDNSIPEPAKTTRKEKYRGNMKNIIDKSGAKIISGMQLKHIAKDIFVMNHLEFYRTTISHPSVMAHLFTDRKITAIENEDWYVNEYSKSHDIDIYIVQVTGTEKCLGIIELKTESLYHRVASMNVILAPAYDDDLGLYKSIIKLGMSKLFQANQDGYKYRKMFMQLLATDKNRIGVLEQIGFKKDALLKEHVLKMGKPRNVAQLYLNEDMAASVLKSKSKS